MRPQQDDALLRARCGEHDLTAADLVLADDDGALFLPLDRAEEIADAAGAIRDTERRQATLMTAGTSLRRQLRFADYLSARQADGATFREHLRAIGGAVEE